MLREMFIGISISSLISSLISFGTSMDSSEREEELESPHDRVCTVKPRDSRRLFVSASAVRVWEPYCWG